MSVPRTLMLVVAATACVDSEPAKPIPGAAIDSDASPFTGSPDGGLRLCGYDSYYDRGPDTPANERHVAVTYGYDTAGRWVSFYVMDDSGIVESDALEYNAMGQLLHDSVTRPGLPLFQFWNLYDSFGRKLRHWTDADDDGVDDSVITYGYAMADQRISSHQVRGARVTDQALHYDQLGRLIALDTTDAHPDSAPLLTVDQYTYDDAAHVMNTTEGTSSEVFFTAVSTYDQDNNLLSYVTSHADPASGAVTATNTTTNTYESGYLKTSLLVQHATPTDGPAIPDAVTRQEFHYGSCQQASSVTIDAREN